MRIIISKGYKLHTLQWTEANKQTNNYDDGDDGDDDVSFGLSFKKSVMDGPLFR